MKVFNFGSINIDHIYQMPHFVRPGETLASTDYTTMLGGKGANQSIALAKAGVDVEHLGIIHHQDAWILDYLSQAGVGTGKIKQQSELATGHAIIQIDAQAENAIMLFAGANHGFSSADIDALLSDAKAGDILLLQNECNQLDAVINRAHGLGMKVMFNPAPMDDSVKALPLDKLGLLIVNEIEAAALFDMPELDLDALPGFLARHYPELEVLVTLGGDGAVFIGGEAQIKVPAHKVKAVDTTAAGDTFIGYFIAGLQKGMPVRDAMALGCKASSITVQRPGASESIPSWQEVE